MNYSEAGKLGAIASRDYWHQQHQNNINKYNEKPVLCKTCHKPLEYSKRKNEFCNHSCAATFTNLGVAHNTVSGKYKKKPCIVCGTISKNPKFCSANCSGKFQSTSILDLWLENNYIVGTKVPRVVRKYVLDRQNGCCAICGLSKWLDKPIPLILDHIDGHSENSHPDNVRLVCGNCDMQLPTYKGKNIGNGRHSRRERYKQGKSY